MTGRSRSIARLAGIVALGILSRTIRTGVVLLDKYLGDALYAAMVYVILTLSQRFPPRRAAIATMAIMAVIETFQLTLIPEQLLASDHLPVRLAARLLGTHFDFRDLAAYAAGICAMYARDRR